MEAIEFKNFSNDEQQTWSDLYKRQAPLRSLQIVPLFSQGLKDLGVTEKEIPDLEKVNRKLKERTGFVGVPVKGFEEPGEFFKMLSLRQFPIGNFIRDPKDLDYTPAPDVFHDLYGHIPFFTDPKYADFCEAFGKSALRFLNRPELLKQFDRFFWFTIEFALTKTSEGLRIFGAGIASSFAESSYSLSHLPEKCGFDLDQIRKHEFKIDEFQSKLYVLDSPDQLYKSLPEFDECLWLDSYDCFVS